MVAELVPLTVTVERRDGQVILALTGELDMISAPQLASCIEQQLDSGASRLILELSALEFCDSTGLRVFIVAANDCTANGGWFRLAAPSPHLVRVLAATGLLTNLPTYHDLAAALHADTSGRIVAD